MSRPGHRRTGEIPMERSSSSVGGDSPIGTELRREEETLNRSRKPGEEDVKGGGGKVQKKFRFFKKTLDK